MSQRLIRMKLLVFGEADAINPDSLYNYANDLSLMSLDLLGEDERFLDVNQADILNFSLTLLNICLMQYNTPKMAISLRNVLDSYEEFKEFGLITIKDGRKMNESLNKEIIRIAIEQEKSFEGDD